MTEARHIQDEPRAPCSGRKQKECSRKEKNDETVKQTQEPIKRTPNV